MLQHFQKRYPSTSLIAELSGIHEGVYIVRALVQVDGKTVATGFASAKTVEQAEDRARRRALEILSILDGVDSIERLGAELEMSNEGTTTDAGLASPSFDLPDSEQLQQSTPGYELTFEKSSLESGSGSEKVLSMGDPTDDSELMMKTTVEIRRLGWSAEQGRRYLEATYSKRSRQHLSREELLEFLNYLQAQATPQ